MTQVRLLTMGAALLAAVVFGMPRLLARQVAPGAPSDLSYLVAPGGGVTLLSDPASEYEETLTKAARVFAAFEEAP